MRRMSGSNKRDVLYSAFVRYASPFSNRPGAELGVMIVGHSRNTRHCEDRLKTGPTGEGAGLGSLP